MDDDRANTAKWLIVLAVVVVIAVLAWVIIRRIDEWMPPSGGTL